MPKQNVYTKQVIIDAAFELVSQKGVEALTARAVAAQIGCSVCPVFTHFSNMEELKQEVVKKAQLYNAQNYIEKGLKMQPAFKGVGVEYIAFAMEKPNLFKLLFMSDNGGLSINNALGYVEYKYPEIVSSVMAAHCLDEDRAKWLYRHMWIYTHGIAVMCVTGTCDFTADDISTMLTEVCSGLLIMLKEKKDDRN